MCHIGSLVVDYWLPSDGLYMDTLSSSSIKCLALVGSSLRSRRGQRAYQRRCAFIGWPGNQRHDFRVHKKKECEVCKLVTWTEYRFSGYKGIDKTLIPKALSYLIEDEVKKLLDLYGMSKMIDNENEHEKTPQYGLPVASFLLCKAGLHPIPCKCLDYFILCMHITTL